ncbi:protein LEG1 homolog [Plectropomus leopardus]|uniref:protein LEG1 homolog n=1 Tax=Plectropomus leopardus TaxID=160734 RepID=UPI001C4ACD5B|nr:protein LEG1 homolog [Plectropomus leopardus]
MMHTATLSLLLASAVALCSTASILDNGMPVMWAQASTQMTDLPMKDGVVTPDPWIALNRMSFFRLMVNATTPFLSCMGTNATDGPMWGLILQIAWMKTSGRYADPTGATTCGLKTGDTMCISPQSWWSCVNYFVSVLPFLSAAKNGFLGENVKVQMQAHKSVEGYCTTYTDCAAAYPDAMTKWDAFFQGLKATHNPPLSDAEKKDTLLGLYWEAQMASLHASAACKDKQSHFSPAEQSFANSWLNNAEYISAAHFHSSLTKAAMYIVPLPSRVLKAGDNAPYIADLTDDENRTLATSYWINYIDSIMGGSLVSSWKKAMCSMETREKGREMMEQLQINPSYGTSTFVSIVTGMSGC